MRFEDDDLDPQVVVRWLAAARQHFGIDSGSRNDRAVQQPATTQISGDPHSFERAHEAIGAC
jgi:hypothetical protein